MKRLKILTLLILSLGLILCFSNVKTKGYYETEGSYVYVYINGVASIRTSYDSMLDYGNGNNLSSNGWPTSWINNSTTSGLTFEKATWDVSGNQVITDFGEFYDSWISNFTIASGEGTISSNVYLWFYDETPSYATITFTCSKGSVNYTSKTITWNCANTFTYDDFPTIFYNADTGNYDSISGGYWFNMADISICNSSYSATLEGGQEYEFDYYIPTSSEEDVEEFDESKWDTLDIPTVFYADESYFKLPSKLGTYSINWTIEYPYETIVYFGTATSDFCPVYRHQPLSYDTNIVISGFVTVDGETHGHEWNILVKGEVTQLEAPVLEIIVDTTACKLQWNFVDKAGSYGIFIDDECIATVNAQTNVYYLPGALPEVGNYVLTVKALSNSSYYSDSVASNGVIYYYNVDYKQIDSPTPVINGHVLSWNSVSGAQFYEIYCDLELVKTVSADVTSLDLYELELTPGTYEFRLVALAEDLENYANSKYSVPVSYTEKQQSIVFYYGDKIIKTIYVWNLQGDDNESKNEYFIANLLPTEISLDNGVGLVQGYYLDKELTDEIDSSIIHNSWSAINYEYLEIYMYVIQPLDYNGPTLIWKNPNAFLDEETITKFVRNACEEGTKDNFILTLKTDDYTGNGNKTGNYNMTYECIVGDYTTTIDLTIRVSNSIKVDYLFNDSWYCSTIVAKPDIVSTAKAVGSLPETELAYTIVTYHNETSVDYYASKPTTGVYSFLITYNSTAGEKGIYRFEMTYFTNTPFEYVEEKSDILPIILTIGGITITIVVVYFFYQKVVKPLKKAKNKKNFNYSYRKKYYRKRGYYR